MDKWGLAGSTREWRSWLGILGFGVIRLLGTTWEWGLLGPGLGDLAVGNCGFRRVGAYPGADPGTQPQLNLHVWVMLYPEDLAWKLGSTKQGEDWGCGAQPRKEPQNPTGGHGGSAVTCTCPEHPPPFSPFSLFVPLLCYVQTQT